MKKSLLFLVLLLVSILVGCQSDSNDEEPNSPKPEKPTKDYEQNRQAFKGLIDDFEREADKKGDVHFDSYEEIARNIRNIYVQVDDGGKKAQVNLISYRGYYCVFSPSPIGKVKAWTGIAKINQENCEKELREAEVNVMPFADGYVIRVRNISTLDLHYIALTRLQEVKVQKAKKIGKADRNNHFAQFFEQKYMMVQASRAIYPKALTEARRNSLFLVDEARNVEVWAREDKSMENQIHFLARSSNVGLGTFHEKGPSEGHEKVAYAKEATSFFNTKNYLLDIHRLLEKKLNLISNEKNISVELNFQLVEDQ